MSIDYKLLRGRSYTRKNARILLAGLAATVLMACLVYCGLLSTWAWFNCSGPIQTFWYSTTTLLQFSLAGYVAYQLLSLMFTGRGFAGWHTITGRGTPPEPPPIAEAPCPVPIHPTPHLVQS